jgi:hypothetical protein
MEAAAGTAAMRMVKNGGDGGNDEGNWNGQ